MIFLFKFWDLLFVYLNFQATRFTIGLVLGTVVFFADLYFVIKGMDEREMARPPAHVERYENEQRQKKRIEEQKQETKKVPVKSAKQKKNDWYQVILIHSFYHLPFL